MQYGYGIDGDGATAGADFSAVRGTHADNRFVRSVREDSEQAARRALESLQPDAPWAVVPLPPKGSRTMPGRHPVPVW